MPTPIKQYETDFASYQEATEAGVNGWVSGPDLCALVRSGDEDAIEAAGERLSAGNVRKFAQVQLIAALASQGIESDVVPTRKAKASAPVKESKLSERQQKLTPAQKAKHVKLRKQANEYKTEMYKAGTPVTTDEAYAKFGTFRARKVA